MFIRGMTGMAKYDCISTTPSKEKQIIKPQTEGLEYNNNNHNFILVRVSNIAQNPAVEAGDQNNV